MDRTPSQTVGPFFSEGLRWNDGGPLNTAAGARVVIAGRVVDGAGEPVGDSLIEARQPNVFARVQTGKDGSFRIDTAMPGGSLPHLDIAVFARGLLKPLHTRLYLAEESKVRQDPALAAICASPRVATLVGRPVQEGEYRWDVCLQGDGETVFFAV